MPDFKLSKLSTPITLAKLYSGAALRSVVARHQRESGLPKLTAEAKNINVSPLHMRLYNEVCGFKDTTQLPVTYPYVLAFKLHMTLLLDKHFPFPLMGLVHIGNQITQHRPILIDENLDIRCHLGEQRSVEKGSEFDIFTRVTVAEELVWEGVGTMLHRNKKAEAKKKAKTSTSLKQQADDFRIRHWSIPRRTGMQYAAVSGDLNPIHLLGLPAKVFGFSSNIAHGMWSKARCLAAVEPLLPKNAYTVDVKFKLPVLLPAKVEFVYAHQQDDLQFELRNRVDDSPHLIGTISTTLES